MKYTQHHKELSESMKRLQSLQPAKPANGYDATTESRRHNFPPRLDIANDCAVKRFDILTEGCSSKARGYDIPTDF